MELTNKNVNQISEEFEESIASEKLIEFSAELIDSITDSLIESPLGDIPYVQYIYKGIKITNSVRDALFYRKILAFMAEASQAEYSERKNTIDEINHDSENEEKFGTAILLILDKIDSFSKAKLLGRSFRFLVNKHISYEVFQQVTHILVQIPIIEIKDMLKNNGEVKTTLFLEPCRKPNFTSLEALGIIRIKHDISKDIRALVASDAMRSHKSVVVGSSSGRKEIQTSSLGYYFADILMNRTPEKDHYRYTAY